ncbi:hypothetical protein FRX31_030165 [Thalictrum thalictroides]|uniref:Uncharacterized protein n=1 Tax=Thalictrum thalictroides TaxID=46969 RepID=A0A7J6V7S8_THATH|nr:hypothetical protein FRX31_030165 [Thalictrum thalictroides]
MKAISSPATEIWSKPTKFCPGLDSTWLPWQANANVQKEVIVKGVAIDDLATHHCSQKNLHCTSG